MNDEFSVENSALQVNPGIDPPPDMSSESLQQFKSKHKKDLTVSEFVEGILKGNVTILSRAITFIESDLPKHQQIASEIINACLPYVGNSIRIGITGVPGVGKSTFIESMGNYVIKQGRKLAVLAIDPSSERSKGSILGDKTRMETLSTNPHAFIRPSPSRGSLGGVAAKTREAMILCEAASFDCIFIETVGVGQSETLVHSMVDFFLLLQLAGAGDELQGIKRGIMEMADCIAITKADGTNTRKAELAKMEYINALSLFPVPESGIKPGVLTCSSINNTGIVAVWDWIQDFINETKQNNYFASNRAHQQLFWFHETIRERLHQLFYNNEKNKSEIFRLQQLISENKIGSYAAANQIINAFFPAK